MGFTRRNGHGPRDPADARRIAEAAHAEGVGDEPDAAAHRYRQALAVLGDSNVSSVHADLLRWHGTVLRDSGRTSEAEPLYRRSLEISRRLGNETGVAQALNCLAGLSQRRGNLRHAAHLLADAAILAESNGEMRLLTMIQSNLGILADIRGDTDAAIGHYRAALWASESANDEQEVAWLLINFGSALGKIGSTIEAERAFARGLSLARSRGDVLAEGLLEENRAELSLARGELDDAWGSIGRALEIATHRRDNVRIAGALKVRGAYERMSGRSYDAMDTLRHGLTLAAVGEDALLGGEMLYQFGIALHMTDNEMMAREVWNAALETFERIDARDWANRVQECIVLGPTGHYL
jgi:tetratricopeptide (TPR) repeat protein